MILHMIVWKTIEELRRPSTVSNEILNSQDVISLFTYTLIEVSLQIIKNWHEQDKYPKNRVRFTAEKITEFLRFMLTTKIQYSPLRGTIRKLKFFVAFVSVVSLILTSFAGQDTKGNTEKIRRTLTSNLSGRGMLMMCLRSSKRAQVCCEMMCCEMMTLPGLT